MARRRDDDDDDRDDDDDDRPRSKRKRSREDDDDDDDLPARKKKKQLSGLDAMFADTSIVALVLFGFCCGWIAVVLSVVALITCTDATAKRNALIVLVIAAVMAAIHTVGGIVRITSGAAKF